MLKLNLAVYMVLAMLYHSSVTGEVITITPHPSGCPPPNVSQCMDIDMGLEMLASSNDVQLSLLPGEHTVSQFIFVANRSGLSIVGIGEDVVVRCQENIGVAFFNITELTFANFTMKQCALSGQSLETVISTYYRIFDEVFSFPEELRIAVSLISCSNVTLDQVTIADTQGIGLLGLNIMGSSRITKSQFSNNHPPECIEGVIPPVGRYRNHIGGGAYMYYQDYEESFNEFEEDNELVVSECAFVNNSDCSAIFAVELYMEFSLALQNVGYFISGGGGLTVIMSQLNFRVKIGVESSSFRQNRAKAGGAAHIGFFSAVTQCSVEFSDCTFEQNNGLLQPPYSGGAVLAHFDLVRPSEIDGVFDYPTIADRNITLRFVDSNFTRNSAYVGAALYVNSLYSETTADNTMKLQIQRCIFEENVALAASAMVFYERKAGGFDNGLQVEIEDSKILRNKVLVGEDFSSSIQSTFGVTISAQYVQLTLRGKNIFSTNRGTALGSVRSTINIFDSADFSCNEGQLGGALSFIDYSFLILQRNASISFTNNTGIVAGGAIYVNFIVNGFSFVYDDCFLYFEKLNGFFCTPESCPRPEDLNVSITFKGNRALSGGIVYGSTLQTCAWALKLFFSPDFIPGSNLYQYFHQRNLIMYFDEEPIGPQQISTSSFMLEVNTTELSGTVMPGQEFTVPVQAFDRYMHVVPDGLTSRISTNDRNLIEDVTKRSMLGASGYWFLDGTIDTSNAPLTVRTGQNDTVNITLLSTDTTSTAEGTFSLVITPCIKGFLFDNETSSCYCDPRLENKGIQCNINQRGLTSPFNVWIGPIEEAEDTSNQEDENGGFTTAGCVLDFCVRSEMLVTNDDFDSQCSVNHHRTGFMCGACVENNSIVLGSNRCRECSNYYLFLIILFAILGILLMTGMFVFQITVAEGYLNSVLFFSNIITLFSVVFSPGSAGRYVFLPTTLLSLNFGIEVCFYDGMDRIATFGLHMAFIAYLFILMGILTLLARYTNTNQPLAYSPAKVFATLIIMCYISLLDICIRIFAFVRVTTLSGDVHVRWFEDPTVPYFQGVHAFYCVVAALIILCYLIPVPLLSFFPKSVYRFKYSSKLKPVYDALWAPFKPKYRWWLGFRLFFRWIPFALASFVPIPADLFYLGLLLVALFLLQSKIQPFQGFWNNLLDDGLVSLMLAIVIGAVYFFNPFTVGGNMLRLAYMIIMVMLLYSILIAVFVCHLFLRFPRMKTCIVELPSRFKKAHKNETVETDKPQGVPNIVITNTEASNTSNPAQSPTDLPEGVRVVSFTEFREPLLDDCGEAEITVSGRYTRPIQSFTHTSLEMNSRENTMATNSSDRVQTNSSISSDHVQTNPSILSDRIHTETYD